METRVWIFTPQEGANIRISSKKPNIEIILHSPVSTNAKFTFSLNVNQSK